MARTRFTVKEGISVADDNAVGGYPLIPVGGLMPYAGATSPEGWLLCDGSAINRTTYANLFALIGTTYGSGNGTTTFNVPDMRSRLPIGAGAGTGLTSRALAATGGAESVVIASGNLPTHVHSINPPSTTSGNDDPGHTHAYDVPLSNTGNDINVHQHYVNDGGAHEHRMYSVIDAAAGTAKARVSSTGSSLGATGISEYIYAHNHGYTAGANQGHYHQVDPNLDYNTTIGGRSAYHQHATDIAPFDSGNGSFANTALATMNPFLSVNYIIKY
jgi:microcystin-dependent protein